MSGRVGETSDDTTPESETEPSPAAAEWDIHRVCHFVIMHMEMSARYEICSEIGSTSAVV